MAALRAIPILKEAGIESRVDDLSPYKDPDEFIKGLNLMDGTYVWILRIVSAVMLGLTAIVYLFERKKHFPVKDDTTTETEENS